MRSTISCNVQQTLYFTPAHRHLDKKSTMALDSEIYQGTHGKNIYFQGDVATVTKTLSV